MECAWAALRMERLPEETAAMAAENWEGVYCFMWEVERGPGILAVVGLGGGFDGGWMMGDDVGGWVG